MHFVRGMNVADYGISLCLYSPFFQVQHVPVDFPQGYNEELSQSLARIPLGMNHAPVPSSFPSSNIVAKNKLPHGLTVHELKEMTKARLQAEAAEKLDGELQQHHHHHRQRDCGASPLDFEISSTSGDAQPRERAMSRESIGRSNSMFHPKPMMGSDMPHAMDGFVRAVGHSPTLGLVNRSETWDSASVASYNSNAFSENFGSESALDVSFDRVSNRTRSFTVPSLPSADGIINISSWPLTTTTHGPTTRGNLIGTPVFDAAVGGNRRRAVTLSPGTGSILEDQPHHGTWTGGERLQLPAFGSKGNTSVHASRQRVYSPVLEELGLDGPFARNRSGDRTALGANLFGSNLSDFRSTSLSSSEFTRESCMAESRVPAPPPGFADSDGRTVAVINRDRLTTFSPHECVTETFLDRGKNPWGGVDPRRRLNTVEDLGRDLGSILHLTGSERQDRNRANTYTYGSDLPISLPNYGRSNGMEENHGMESFQY
jgi:hypothetical protein